METRPALSRRNAHEPSNLAGSTSDDGNRVCPCGHAQSGKLQGFRVRLKTRSKSVVGTTIEARDQYEAVVKLQRRYPAPRS